MYSFRTSTSLPNFVILTHKLGFLGLSDGRSLLVTEDRPVWVMGTNRSC